MATRFLFDAEAICAVLRPAPLPGYLGWLQTIGRDRQYTSAVVIGQLCRAARRLPEREDHEGCIWFHLLRTMTVLPFDSAIAREYGRLCGLLHTTDHRLTDVQLWVAATARYHGMGLVTCRVGVYEPVLGPRVRHVAQLARAGAAPPEGRYGSRGPQRTATGQLGGRHPPRGW